MGSPYTCSLLTSCIPVCYYKCMQERNDNQLERQGDVAGMDQDFQVLGGSQVITDRSFIATYCRFVLPSYLSDTAPVSSVSLPGRFVKTTGHTRMTTRPASSWPMRASKAEHVRSTGSRPMLTASRYSRSRGDARCRSGAGKTSGLPFLCSSGSPMTGAPREFLVGQCLLPHRDGTASSQLAAEVSVHRPGRAGARAARSTRVW